MLALRFTARVSTRDGRRDDHTDAEDDGGGDDSGGDVAVFDDLFVQVSRRATVEELVTDDGEHDAGETKHGRVGQRLAEGLRVRAGGGGRGDWNDDGLGGGLGGAQRGRQRGQEEQQDFFHGAESRDYVATLPPRPPTVNGSGGGTARRISNTGRRPVRARALPFARRVVEQRGGLSSAAHVNPPASPPSRAALVAAFATIYVVWGSTYLAIHVAVESIPPFVMAGTRFVLAGAVLLAWQRARGAAWPTAAQWRDHAITGFFLLLGGNGLVAWAEQTVPSGVAALVIGVTPLCMVLAEWAAPGGRRPGAQTLGAMAVGLAGVAWLAAPWERPGEGGLPLAGTLALVAASALWAIGSIHSRHVRSGGDVMTGAALQMLTGGAMQLVAAVALGEFSGFDPAAVPGRAWGAFFYLIVFGSLVGFSTFAWLIRHSRPALVATYAWVNPVVAVWLGWQFQDEPLTPRTLAAAAVIVAAVVLVTLQKNASAPARAKD
jgi:drug/metabolite transporter (DMT)-like permease